jgi:membrane protein DedA with SNARE-associated domain
VNQFVQPIVHFVSAHSHEAYATLFLASFLEAVPVVGSFIPGSTIILSLSALIPAGDLNLAGVLAVAIGGAVIGDGLAYGIGHRYPHGLRKVWPLSKYPEVVERSEVFFGKYGDAAVFLARFLPPVRAFVPITAGALGMRPRRFFPINIAAILCWAPAHVVPGMLAGTAYGHAGAIGDHLMMPIVVGIVVVAILVWAIRRWTRPAEA